MSASEPGAGPATHYDFFSGLRAAGVANLAAGALALVLHGVPRLTSEIELVADPAPDNRERLARLLRRWGYAEEPAAAALRRRHPRCPLAQIDVALPEPEEFRRLVRGAGTADLIDLRVAFVGLEDLRLTKERSGTRADREDAAALALLLEIRAGRRDAGTDPRVEQIRKFSRWSVPARLDWILSAARLARGLSPEARPMTHGLTRRRPWVEPRRRG